MDLMLAAAARWPQRDLSRILNLALAVYAQVRKRHPNGKTRARRVADATDTMEAKQFDLVDGLTKVRPKGFAAPVQ
jgi:hypothetical protein